MAGGDWIPQAVRDPIARQTPPGFVLPTLTPPHGRTEPFMQVQAPSVQRGLGVVHVGLTTHIGCSPADHCGDNLITSVFAPFSRATGWLI